MAFLHAFRNSDILARPEKAKSIPDVEQPDRPKILDNTKIQSIKSQRNDGIFVYFGLLFIGTVVGYIAYGQLTSNKVAIFPSSREKDVSNTLSSIDNKIFADPSSLEYKVSNFLLPLSYILFLSSDMSNTYCGTVTIKLKCMEDTSIVGLHSSQHIMGHIEVKAAVDMKAIDVVSYSRKYNILMIMLKEKLISGYEYNVFISFHGNVTEGSKGLFFRKYQDGDGTKRKMLSGTFQFGRAKYVFPCIDDTAYKASFKITLQHKKMLTAISNMPVKRFEILRNGLVQTFFEISPMMSIDHVVFVVADLLYQEIVISSGLKVRLYAPQGRLNETLRAGRLIQSLIEYYQIMFGVDYSFKKLDFVPMVMLSTQTSFSPGLSILPEEAFLLDIHTATLTQAEAHVLTIGQAVAKQVFPCMMAVDLRRNARFIESLVIYLGYQAASNYYPMWGLQNQFYIDVTNMALNQDENAGTTFDSNHHFEMSSMHHDLKGKAVKGAALLNMMLKYIGESKVHESIMLSCIPLTQSGNTLIARLMDILLQNVLQADVDILKFWFENIGFPLLSLSSGVAPSQYTFRQKSFIDTNSTKLKAASFNWPIPIFLKSVCDATTKRLLLQEESGTIKLSDCYLHKVNSHGHGFYRVNYSNSDWENFVRLFNENHKKLSADDRANLISDAFEIARFNPQYINIALGLTQYLNKEHDYTPYKIALTQLKKLVNLFYDVKIGTYLQDYIGEKTEPVLNTLSLLYKPSHKQRKLIGLLTREAVLHQKIVRVRIENMFLCWLVRDTIYQIPKHLRELVFEVGILYGSSYEWLYLFEYFKKVPSVAEKNLALSGLSATHRKFLLERLMEYSRKCEPSSVVCIQQRLTIWLKICKNDHGGNDMAKKAFYADWMYIQKNIEEIYDTIEAFLLGCLGSGKFVSDKELLESIDISLLAQSSKDLFGKVIDHINQNINLRRKEEDIMRWLKFNSSWI